MVHFSLSYIRIMLLYILLRLAGFSTAQQNLRPFYPSTISQPTLFSGNTSHDLVSPFRLFGRQEQCEDPGYLPCPDDPEYCCPPDNDCYPELGMCCIEGGVTCGYKRCYQAGSICCPETGACNGETNQTCCEAESQSGCCDAGYTCCPGADNCCAPGETCCEDVCCPKGTNCSNGQCVPVLELPYTPLVLDHTVKNMCLWMGGANEATLTYSNVRNDGGKCGTCCNGVTVPAGQPYEGEPTSCDEAPFAKTYEALQPGANLACVERYENSFQGWWFGRWSAYTKANIPGFGDKSKFIVRVTGLNCADVKLSDLLGCAMPVTTTPKLLRMRDDGASPTSGPETQVIPSTVANSTGNLVIVALGDLDPGTYSMQAQMQGPVSDVMLLDNMGDEVGESNTVSVSNLDAGSSFQFTISEMAIGAALFIETSQAKVNVTWNVQSSSSAAPTTVTSLPSTFPTTAITPTKPSRATNLAAMPRPVLLLFLTLALFMAV